MTESIRKMYDYLVIGGGSGGLASARKAASYGIKAAVIEHGRLGGTCVNVGCVPKKVMWIAASIAEKMTYGYVKDYGFNVTPDDAKINWGMIKKKRDEYVKKLNGIYAKLLDKADVDLIHGDASFTADGNVIVDNKDVFKAKNYLIATGGYPTIPKFPGHEHCISSDGFFELEELPRKTVVVGAGYIAVELAGVLKELGSNVTLLIRKNKVLRNFDSTISSLATENLIQAGVNLMTNTSISSVTKNKSNGLLSVNFDVNGDKRESINDVDKVLLAIGRSPSTESLNLPAVGVKTDEHGHIQVDEFQNTSRENIYALGDVCGKALLTPVAIAAGRRLSNRLFNGEVNSKLDYENIPTVVFSHPPIGTVGMTQEEAISKLGADKIKVYMNSFVGLYHAMTAHKTKTTVKLICYGEEEKVVGLHILGSGAEEMLQGSGRWFKLGAV
ncbi:glutathione reductase, mitochondrial-like isoform X2 [Xenia sp. Carnegie-2017]|uniref:glutathione reductase, mitochondrial-like isoform X2 n=1 Tax=Xenia sp. Carnegie-2017 TaxID=2897299 RepID=UPI001F03D8ED|nr:glutathione reductase, mitochondrial-like isoform X2 [Xenia sp. Carnegie-2017]